MFTINVQDRAGFERQFARMNDTYDPEWKALKSYLGSAKYHTKLSYCDVHSTRAAFKYSVALLDNGETWALERAVEVLDHALDLQDQDPANATFGIWSWNMEEPLWEMAPPDWNWADFCGKELLQVKMHHSDRLPDALNEKIKDAIRNCCLSIFRRNMHNRYTNISIMGSYVTLCGGEQYGWDDMFRYGKSRFEKFAAFTRENGGFAEYNSPTYTVEAIQDLSRIAGDVRDPEISAIGREMAAVGWRTLAEHYHVSTGQWCGPFARAYSWPLKDETISFIQHGLKGYKTLLPSERFTFDTAWTHIDMQCPAEYLHYFDELECRDVDLGFIDGMGDVPTRVAISHIHPKYTLSSFTYIDTWNQRRNLLGFWGGGETRFMNAALLHDYYDFSSGMLVVAQKGGAVLAMATLRTDGGDTHCNLDMIQNETISCRDLRLRIELGGALPCKPVLEDGMAILHDGEVTLKVALAGGSFNGQALSLELSDSVADEKALEAMGSSYRRFEADKETRQYIDVVFYHSDEPVELSLAGLSDAWAALAVSLGDAAVRMDCAAQVTDGIARARFETKDGVLAVESPAKPVPCKAWSGDALIDGQSVNAKYGCRMATGSWYSELKASQPK